MIFNMNHNARTQFWNKQHIPTFDDAAERNIPVLMGNFTKIGRTFQQKCQRSYFLVKQWLLYSDVGTGNIIKGYVELDRVYAQFKVIEKEYHITLNYFGKPTTLMTEEFKQFQTWKEALSSCCILIDFEENYILEEEIGNGSFSIVQNKQIQVHKCKNKMGQSFAVKIINKQKIKAFNKNKPLQEQLLNEILALRFVNHPNILKLYQVYESPQKLYIITELIEGCEVVSAEASKKIFQQEDIKIFLIQILEALLHIQELQIMHRDIKPHNILLRNNNLTSPCLIDFGLAAFEWQKNPPFPQCGSPGYSAPEVIKYEESKKLYNTQCDIFSLGITVFVILYGYNPFKSADCKQTLKRNVKAFFEIPNSKYPTQLENLICQMTKKYPKDRITPLKALEHPFFQTPFFYQLQLPAQILTKNQHDINYKTDANINFANASADLDQGRGASYGNYSMNMGIKQRAISIMSNPQKGINHDTIPNTNNTSIHNYSPKIDQQFEKITQNNKSDADFDLDLSEPHIEEFQLEKLTFVVNRNLFNNFQQIKKSNIID